MAVMRVYLAHAEAGRVAVHRDRAGVGREVALGVLGRDAALNGDATRRDVLLVESRVGKGGVCQKEEEEEAFWVAVLLPWRLWSWLCYLDEADVLQRLAGGDA